MKNKLSVLIATFLLCSIGAVLAQSPIQNKGDVTLNVKLEQIMELKINQTSVDLVYSTMQHYNDGVSETINDQITVSATGGFKIQVVATEFSNVPDGKTFPLNSVSIQAIQGTTNPITAQGFGTAALNLSTTTQTLFTSNDGGFEKNFGVKYTGAKDNAYFNILGTETDRTVTTTVTYTIVAQ